MSTLTIIKNNHNHMYTQTVHTRAVYIGKSQNRIKNGALYN